MEARLLHAHKIQTTNSRKREWRIINPSKNGIQVDETQIPDEHKKFFNAEIRPDVSHFLADLAGEGGPWDGWTLYAVGKLMYTKDLKIPTPHFPLVFVRKARAGEKRASEGFEVVGEKEGLWSMYSPIVLGGDTPATRGR